MNYYFHENFHLDRFNQGVVTGPIGAGGSVIAKGAGGVAKSGWELVQLRVKCVKYYESSEIA